MSVAPRFHDRYGLPLSTASPTAAERYSEGIDRTLAATPGADQCFAQALEADEGFALAEVAIARNLQVQGDLPGARARAARARTLVAGATHREQQHVDAIATAIESGGPAALALVKEHVTEFPRDAYVLSQANGVFGLIGFSGRQDRNDEQLALLESVAGDYGDDWWFLSAYAFALNELFRTEEARPLAERSLSLYARNAHAAHTMGHVLYESGDAAGGATFLDTWLEDYDRAGQLHGHLSWHLALFELAAGRYSRALQIFQRNIHPEVTHAQPLIAVSDSASLLWRAELYGCAAEPLPWQDVAALAARAFPKPGITFADVHAALAFAAAGDDAALSALIDGLRERAAQGRLPAGEGVIDLVEGLAAHRRGDYEATVRRIEPVADQIIRIGGSHAQRDVFEETLLDAYLRTGRHEQAEALLTMRLERRPSARDSFWLGRARAARGTPDATLLQAAISGWSSADPDSRELAVLRDLQGV
jgi:tetratricopeptide (TPR) repeat protein